MALKKKAKPKKPVELPLRGIARFLEANGWKVFVIGGKSSIQQPFGASMFNYELVIQFTGAKKVNP